MQKELEKLPSEANKLQQIIATLYMENDTLSSEKELLQKKNHSLKTTNNSLLSEVELLKEQLRLLKAKRFGRSSEKLDSQIKQLELWIEESELNSVEVVTTEAVVDTGESQGNCMKFITVNILSQMSKFSCKI